MIKPVYLILGMFALSAVLGQNTNGISISGGVTAVGTFGSQIDSYKSLPTQIYDITVYRRWEKDGGSNQLELAYQILDYHVKAINFSAGSTTTFFNGNIVTNRLGLNYLKGFSSFGNKVRSNIYVGAGCSLRISEEASVIVRERRLYDYTLPDSTVIVVGEWVDALQDETNTRYLRDLYFQGFLGYRLSVALSTQLNLVASARGAFGISGMSKIPQLTQLMPFSGVFSLAIEW